MRLQPQHASGGCRINTELVPPRGFVAAAMDLAVVPATERDSEFITDLAPSAGDCAKRRWWASAGRRPHTKHGCLATDLTWSRSRMRRGVGKLSTVLSTTLRRRFLSRCCTCVRFADGAAGGSLVSFDSCTWKALSTRSASAASKVFFAASA